MRDRGVPAVYRDTGPRRAAHATGSEPWTTRGMAPRTLALLGLAFASCTYASCTDPLAPALPQVASPPEVRVGAVAIEPPRDDGRVPAVVRIRLSLSTTAPADVARAGRVLLVAGGADALEVEAYAKGRTTAALRAREIPLVAWGEPSGAPSSIVVRPSRVLPRGRSTLIVLFDRGSPFAHDLDVSDDQPIARRIWPPTKTTPDGPLTYCSPPPFAPSESEVVVDPSGSAVELRAHASHGCVDLAVPAGSTVVIPPPALGSVLLDPEPIAVGLEATATEPPCPEDAIDLGGLCARVDDDRVILHGGVKVPRAVLGFVAGRPLVAPLAPLSRVVARGLSPSTTISLELTVREPGRELRITRALRTKPRRRHVVVNEVLARAPSGSAAQRFVELVNDGDRGVDLQGLLLVDGTTEIELPNAWLEPGAFALLTPEGWVDGLAGDAAPPAGTLRLVVDALKLNGEIALLERDGAPISRFPASTSTRTISRGRRAPDRPDDAPDAFGWDADGRATPGLPNAIAP